VDHGVEGFQKGREEGSGLRGRRSTERRTRGKEEKEDEEMTGWKE
jgi:hypothetical protein